MADKFPTEFYEKADVLVCPNGDKLRSDVDGIFCWIEGERVSAEVVNGKVRLLPSVEPTEKKSTKKVKEVEVTDGNG